MSRPDPYDRLIDAIIAFPTRARHRVQQLRRQHGPDVYGAWDVRIGRMYVYSRLSRDCGDRKRVRWLMPLDRYLASARART